jgi:hypothetical protein
MIEQQGSLLQISFPSPEAARAFHLFLQSLLTNQSAPVISEPPSESPLQDSPAPVRSQHVVLTPERQEQLFNQRQNGQTAHQRILNAQTTLRDGVLPFSKPGEAPQPTSQPSPRMKGVFADGAPQRSPDPLQERALPTAVRSAEAPVGPTAPALPAPPEKKSKLRQKPPVAQ